MLADEDYGERCTGGNDSVQHFIEMPARKALAPVFESSPGSTQTACSRQPVPSMPEDLGIPLSSQSTSSARHSCSSNSSKGRDFHLPGRGMRRLCLHSARSVSNVKQYALSQSSARLPLIPFPSPHLLYIIIPCLQSLRLN